MKMFSATVNPGITSGSWWIDPDAEGVGVSRRVDVDRLPLHAEGASVGAVRPLQHAHEGGLARAVLADEREDLARPELQRDAAQGLHHAEALRYPLHRDSGRGRCGLSLPHDQRPPEVGGMRYLQPSVLFSLGKLAAFTIVASW